jgi:hypothetical protein
MAQPPGGLLVTTAATASRAQAEQRMGINALGVKYFSSAVARRKLEARLANLFGEGV